MYISTQIKIAEIEEHAFNISAEYSRLTHIPDKFHIKNLWPFKRSCLYFIITIQKKAIWYSMLQN